MAFGGAAVWFLPNYARPYLDNVLAPSAVVEGEVVDKESQTGRVVVKVTTAEGVLLASFTENQACNRLPSPPARMSDHVRAKPASRVTR
jgi:hypothetical protein